MQSSWPAGPGISSRSIWVFTNCVQDGLQWYMGVGLFLQSSIYSPWQEAGKPSNAQFSGSMQKIPTRGSAVLTLFSPSSTAVPFTLFQGCIWPIKLQNTFCLYHCEKPQLTRTWWGHDPRPLNWCLSYCLRAKRQPARGHRDRQGCCPSQLAHQPTQLTKILTKITVINRGKALFWKGQLSTIRTRIMALHFSPFTWNSNTNIKLAAFYHPQFSYLRHLFP